MSGATIFQACRDKVADGWGNRIGDVGSDDVVRKVIQTIIDHTPSPRTVDELTRILAEADAG